MAYADNRAARVLVNLWALVLLPWFAVVIYWWVRDDGLMGPLLRFFRGYVFGPVAAFSLCAFAGIVPATALFLGLYRLLRRR